MNFWTIIQAMNIKKKTERWNHTKYKKKKGNYSKSRHLTLIIMAANVILSILLNLIRTKPQMKKIFILFKHWLNQIKNNSIVLFFFF